MWYEGQQFVKGLQTSDDLEQVTLNAITAFIRFPFFSTAQVVYGPMNNTEKDRLWSLGQKRLALLRHVIKGGVYRYKASKWLKRNASQELALFQAEWAAFNSDMYRSRVKISPQSAIVSLWRLQAESNNREVEVRLRIVSAFASS